MANELDSQIVNYVHRYGELSIKELGNLLGTSPSSVRRSLNALSKHRLIERTHGGARVATIMQFDSLDVYRLPVDPKEARAIAARAAQLVQRGDIVGLSGGQICTQFALHLRLIEGITVVTNALTVAAELAGLPNLQVVLAGGRLIPKSFELVGQAVGLSLNGLHIHKFFLGTAGISLEHGVTAYFEAEADAARVLMQHSDSTILLANSERFKKANFAQVCPVSSIRTIVTTDQVPSDMITQFERSGVEMIVANCG